MTPLEEVDMLVESDNLPVICRNGVCSRGDVRKGCSPGEDLMVADREYSGGARVIPELLDSLNPLG